MKYQPWLILISLFVAPGRLWAQVPENMSKALQSYDRDHAPEYIYLHLDKTTYLSHDPVWFSAYQVSMADSSQNTLFVSLQHLATDSVLLTARFVMQQGFAKGCINLPESIPPGTYRLRAYSNVQLSHPNKELPVQFIHIENGEGKSWQLQPTTGPTTGTQGYQATYQLRQPDQSPATKKTLLYRIMDGRGIVASGKAKTTPKGEVTFTLPDSLKNKTLQLCATMYDGKTRQYFNQVIDPVPAITIKLFPESGALLEGQRCKVAYELRSKNQLSQGIKGEVLENGIPIAALQGNDPYTGSFYLTPKKEALYTIRFDTALTCNYQFPEVRKEGYALSMPKAVVRDSLTLQVHSFRNNNEVYIILHDYSNVLLGKKIRFADNTTTLTLPLDEAWEGLVAATLLDMDGEPLAERSAFIRPRKNDNVTINTDSILYHTRSPVKVKIRIRDSEGKPAKGVFSLAAVASPLYDSLWVTDLPTYYYAGRYLPGGAPLPSFQYLSDQAVDLLLLTRFYTRFRWKNDTNNIPVPSVAAGIKGRVTYSEKPLKIPATLLLASGKEITPFSTDSSGNFSLDMKQLYGQSGTDIFLSPVTDKKRRYIHAFKTNTNAGELNTLQFTLVSRPGIYPPYRQAIPDEATEEEQLGGLYKINRLQEVKIRAKREDPVELLKRKYDKVGNDIYIGDCGRDYLCGSYHGMDQNFGLMRLNCPEHITGMKPIDGTYYFNPNQGTKYRAHGVVMYIGCPDTTLGKYATILNATWYSREFYYADTATQAQQDYIPSSTVFWAHKVVTNDNGEAEIPYFTNDITGRFLIHLQGFTANGPLSAKYYYRVAGD